MKDDGDDGDAVRAVDVSTVLCSVSTLALALLSYHEITFGRCWNGTRGSLREMVGMKHLDFLLAPKSCRLVYDSGINRFKRGPTMSSFGDADPQLS